MNDFVADWGDAGLGPLAEPFLSDTASGDDNDDAASGEGGYEELSELWPRLSQIHEGMQDLEASRTKVDLARQIAVDGSNPESIVHALGKVLVTTPCFRIACLLFFHGRCVCFLYVVLPCCVACRSWSSLCPYRVVLLQLLRCLYIPAGFWFRFEVS